MLEKVSLIYNDKKIESIGLYLYDFPDISMSNFEYESFMVSKKNGEYIRKNKSKKNIVINCKFGIVDNNIRNVIRKCNQFFTNKGNLFLTETKNTFYKVIFVEKQNFERELKKFGVYEVNFICEPYEYDVTGSNFIPVTSQKFYNNFSESQPLFKIIGEGVCNFSINGNRFKVNVTDEVYIDTNLFETYNAENEVLNTEIAGDYDLMILKHGENVITFDDGFKFFVKPNWGYDL